MHLALVSCGKIKRDYRCPALSMYTGELFRKASTWAGMYSDDWMILSAKYGAMDPFEEIDPYDMTLHRFNGLEIRKWSKGCLDQIMTKHHGVQVITFLAGKKYMDCMRLMLEPLGIIVFSPLSGMGIGKQLAYLKHAIIAREP